ncbi:hypothetical protein [Maridesulfovibrio hydrothermalis]|uniref:ABC-type transport auxiliary lipoprotein component domain-containing protein n=1 Tax=Maridesulfovibrio hydrothermalis AM13 = DSM 14728 TaxID=1121451 RepID=L0R8B5_9BACT|nr:hypothetical protein [Maridesulfovibrio hydrothermalis]CCO23003.1 conserved protein of unknown function [Maridesulfovibrio hydrothermalis AM13 = DSM 14728]
MITRILGLIVVVAAIFTGGCIGGKSVESSYLRVGVSSDASLACEEVKKGIPKLAVKRFVSLPALDRETVIIAQGSVLKPDYRWSWEGTPAEIFDLTAGPALSCMNNYEVVTPYRPGLKRALILSGVIMSFELQRKDGEVFKAAVRYSLWDSSGKELLARKYIEAGIPVKSIDGHSIAEAAQQAMNSVMQKTVIWVDGFDSEILSRNTK